MTTYFIIMRDEVFSTTNYNEACDKAAECMDNGINYECDKED